MHIKESSGSKQSWNKIFGTNALGLSPIVSFTIKLTFSRLSLRKKRKQAERKKQISSNGFLLLPGKMSIYSVDLNFISRKP